MKANNSRDEIANERDARHKDYPRLYTLAYTRLILRQQQRWLPMSLASAPPSYLPRRSRRRHCLMAVDLSDRSPCAVPTAPPAVPFRRPTATCTVGAVPLWDFLVRLGRVCGALDLGTLLHRGSLYHRDLGAIPGSRLRCLDPAPVHGPGRVHSPWRVHRSCPRSASVPTMSRGASTAPPVWVHGPWVP
jgi:hypothetical protein